MSYATYAMKAAGDFYSVSEGSVVSGKTAVVNRENLASDRGHVEKTRALVAGEKVDVKGQVYELDAAESYSDMQRSTLMQEAALVGLYTSVGIFIGADSASAEFYAIAGYDADKNILIAYATYDMKEKAQYYSVRYGQVMQLEHKDIKRQASPKEAQAINIKRKLVVGESVFLKGDAYSLKPGYTDQERSTIMNEAASVGLYSSFAAYIGSDINSAELYSKILYDTQKDIMLAYATTEMLASGSVVYLDEEDRYSVMKFSVGETARAMTEHDIANSRGLAAGDVWIDGEVQIEGGNNLYKLQLLSGFGISNFSRIERNGEVIASDVRVPWLSADFVAMEDRDHHIVGVWNRHTKAALSWENGARHQGLRDVTMTAPDGSSRPLKLDAAQSALVDRESGTRVFLDGKRDVIGITHGDTSQLSSILFFSAGNEMVSRLTLPIQAGRGTLFVFNKNSFGLRGIVNPAGASVQTGSLSNYRQGDMQTESRKVFVVRHNNGQAESFGLDAQNRIVLVAQGNILNEKAGFEVRAGPQTLLGEAAKSIAAGGLVLHYLANFQSNQMWVMETASEALIARNAETFKYLGLYDQNGRAVQELRDHPEMTAAGFERGDIKTATVHLYRLMTTTGQEQTVGIDKDGHADLFLQRAAFSPAGTPEMILFAANYERDIRWTLGGRTAQGLVATSISSGDFIWVFGQDGQRAEASQDKRHAVFGNDFKTGIEMTFTYFAYDKEKSDGKETIGLYSRDRLVLVADGYGKNRKAEWRFIANYDADIAWTRGITNDFYLAETLSTGKITGVILKDGFKEVTGAALSKRSVNSYAAEAEAFGKLSRVDLGSLQFDLDSKRFIIINSSGELAVMQNYHENVEMFQTHHFFTDGSSYVLLEKDEYLWNSDVKYWLADANGRADLANRGWRDRCCTGNEQAGPRCEHEPRILSGRQCRSFRRDRRCGFHPGSGPYGQTRVGCEQQSAGNLSGRNGGYFPVLPHFSRRP